MRFISIKSGILLNGDNSLKNHFLFSLERILYFEQAPYGAKVISQIYWHFYSQSEHLIHINDDYLYLIYC